MESSQILTINVIIITGLLILITIGTPADIDAEYNRFLLIGTAMIIPFVISSLFEIRKSRKNMNEYWFRSGSGWMFTGFILMLMIMAVMVFLESLKHNYFQ